MAQKTTTSKQDEIKLIKKLHDMNGYFAAAFCHDDLAVMENNINATTTSSAEPPATTASSWPP